LRCIPQVLGPAVEALSFLKTKLEIEINSATDNPLLFADGSVLSGGNFHGQILGLALEMAGMAMAEVGNIAERQIDRLLTSTNRGLPLFLIKEQGLNSGLMLSQYTAAALVSENKVLCHPALTDSIPTSAGKEDHNSLAPISGRKALRILDNLEKIIAIEYLCAAQAIDFQDKGKLAPATRAIYDRIRKLVCHTDRDTYMAPKIEQLASAVHTGKLINGKL
jgi:histidine ammonia-lyase